MAEVLIKREDGLRIGTWNMMGHGAYEFLREQLESMAVENKLNSWSDVSVEHSAAVREATYSGYLLSPNVE